MRCSYVRTCRRCVRHIVTQAHEGLRGERLTATYRYCEYHWHQTRLADTCGESAYPVG
jgi:hypothetical protein